MVGGIFLSSVLHFVRWSHQSFFSFFLVNQLTFASLVVFIFFVVFACLWGNAVGFFHRPYYHDSFLVSHCTHALICVFSHCFYLCRSQENMAYVMRYLELFVPKVLAAIFFYLSISLMFWGGKFVSELKSPFARTRQ